MAKRTRKNPAQLKSELNGLNKTKDEVAASISATILEARAEMQSSILSLLNQLVGEKIPGTQVGLLKLKRSKKWVFQITFSEDDIKNRAEVSSAIAELNGYSTAVGIKNPIEQEDR